MKTKGSGYRKRIRGYYSRIEKKLLVGSRGKGESEVRERLADYKGWGGGLPGYENFQTKLVDKR